MRQFVLIDHSLQDLGGHHYPLAVSILEAAERAGYAPVLATHRRFTRQDALPRHWTVRALFKHRSYSRFALDTQSSLQTRRSDKHRILRSLGVRWRQLQRKRITRDFAANCRQLFATLRLTTGDVVLVATASELDLAGLARFLPGSALPREVAWHLQFHFGIFRGRDPDYDRQQTAQLAMHASLQTSLHTLEGWRLFMYCTTEPLTRQYQRLALAPFTTLPYPVHALFRAPPLPRASDQAVRIACLGHSRREKRHGLLPQILRELWDDYFAVGKAQLLLQSDRAASRQLLAVCVAELQAAQPPTIDTGAVPVRYGEASLDLASYAQLLRSSDIGLLLYDGERYFDRCSGVLLELLSSGVPVVVPAASWLAAQIATANQRYLAVQAQQLAQSQRLTPLDWLWNGATTGGSWPAQCAGLLLQAAWPDNALPGQFMRIALRSVAANAGVTQHVEVIGDFPRGATVQLLMRVAPESEHVELEYEAAFNTPALAISTIQISAVQGSLPPLGAIGLALAEPGGAAGALREILEHREHYQRHASEFSREFAAAHDAAMLLARLAPAS